MTLRALAFALPIALALVATGCAAEPADDDADESSASAVSASKRDEVVDAARANRLVGEQATGYLGVVDDRAVSGTTRAPSDLAARVQHINIQRRALYTETAVKNRLTVSTIAESTACLLLRDRVKVGEAYRTEDETWKVRVADEAIEMPSYCPAR